VKKWWPEVVVGDVWRDRDPRMWSGNRRVRVTGVRSQVLGESVVTYKQVVGANNAPTGREFTSRYGRFQRAFEPIETQK
jgi:hypothetical protein